MVAGLIDQRCGQLQDHVFISELKSELIQQFVIDMVRRDKVSRKGLAGSLKNDVNMSFAPEGFSIIWRKWDFQKLKGCHPLHLVAVKKHLKWEVNTEPVFTPVIEDHTAATIIEAFSQLH